MHGANMKTVCDLFHSDWNVCYVLCSEASIFWFIVSGTGAYISLCNMSGWKVMCRWFHSKTSRFSINTKYILSYRKTAWRSCDLPPRYRFFLGFPVSWKQMLRWYPTFQDATTCYSCSPPDVNVHFSSTISSSCNMCLKPLPPGESPIAVK
jgi:hypothetical protein